MTWHNETEAAERLRGACGNLGDHETVTVPVGALLTVLRAVEDHSTCEADHEAAMDEARKDDEKSWTEEMEDVERRHADALESLREEMQDRIDNLQAEMELIA